METNKTRDEAEKIIRDIQSKYRYEAAHVRSQVLDATEQVLESLYPKPESERLKQLKEAKRCAGGHYCIKLQALVQDLIDEAIKAEEAKQ